MNIIVIGIVAPVGTVKKYIIRDLKKEFDSKGYKPIVIKITDLLWKNKRKPTAGEKCLDVLCKMNISNHLRKSFCKSFMACLAVEEIFDYCNDKKNRENNTVFILDQIKHKQEHKLLSHLFGLSYIQISIYNDDKDKRIAELNSVDEEAESYGVYQFSKNSIYDADNCSIVMKQTQEEYKKAFNKENINHYLIDKDMHETLREYHDSNSGQQVDKLFHLSHYFINQNNDSFVNDRKCEITHVQKFCRLLFSEWEELPSQDEFGMSLAYQASFTSNFPGKRQIGACIVSKKGEVITAAGIKSPSMESINKILDEKKALKGYKKYKDKINEWKDILDKNLYNEIIEFIDNNLDFHPSTHAEMNAICNAAKLGVSIREATLYSTTYPCHLCAKDIINSGISKIVYIEQYPKSKNEELYSDIISTEEKSNKFPILTFQGVGPRRYHYVYDLEFHNKYPTENYDSNSESKLETQSNSMPIFLKYLDYKYDYEKIHDVIKMFKLFINKNDYELEIYRKGEIKTEVDLSNIKVNLTKKYNFVIDIDLLLELLDDIKIMKLQKK